MSIPIAPACSPSHLHRFERLMMKLPSLCICGGVGRRKARFSVRKRNRSSFAGVVSGAPRSFQSGSSSFRDLGSRTAPERMCAPTSEPFSSTTIERSVPFASASCFRRIAAVSPAGPAPTITTSTSMLSRSISAMARSPDSPHPPQGMAHGPARGKSRRDGGLPRCGGSGGENGGTRAWVDAESSLWVDAE
ncbi:MAG: hypothetical protein KatS3mg082_3388 [Nitrospiraceae bacterium]|nr:MAG: hypothetical protein KatS3mg082_3388 [Nitrospiraceae bacterium]